MDRKRGREDEDDAGNGSVEVAADSNDDQHADGGGGQDKRSRPASSSTAIIAAAYGSSSSALIISQQQQNSGELPRTSSLEAPIMQLTGHGASVTGIDFDARGANLLSCSKDKSICEYSATRVSTA